jgi:D-arabinose 1-dehydrogenase-like Zn-dependent alcohol dehydrogenase
MKAICVSEFGDPEVLKLEDLPEPRPPQSGGVLVSVNAAGLTEESYAQKMRDWRRLVSASIRYVCDETTG